MKKKVLAMMLSMCMAAGIVMTANAAAPATTTVSGGDAGYTSPDYKVDATVNTPFIKVIVPSVAPKMVINPFKLTYTDENGAPMENQIITVPQEIVNESNVPIQVDVVNIVATKNDDSDLVLATAVPAATVKTKSVFLYLEAQFPDASGDFKFSPNYDTKNVKTQYVITNKATTKTNFITLKEGNDTPAKAQYKIGGTVVASPTTPATVKPWNDKDTITVSYKFNFMPVLPITETK